MWLVAIGRAKLPTAFSATKFLVRPCSASGIATFHSDARGDPHTAKHESPSQRPELFSVDLTHQHTNRAVLVEGPEITIGLVGRQRVGEAARVMNTVSYACCRR